MGGYPDLFRSLLGGMNILFGALCLLAVGAWLKYRCRQERLYLLRVLALIPLSVAAWLAVGFYETAGMRDEERRCRAGSVGKDLIHTMNSTNLDGISRE